MRQREAIKTIGQVANEVVGVGGDAGMVGRDGG